MSENMVAIVLFLSIAWGIVAVARVVGDVVTRRELIRGGASAQQAQEILAARAGQRDTEGPLKLGLLSIAVGAGLTLVQFLPYGAEDPIVYGIVIAFAGAGLLAYVAIPSRRLSS